MIAKYPKFPQPRNIPHLETMPLPKDSDKSLGDALKLLRSFGLMVVAKRIDDKRPLAEWRGLDRANYSQVAQLRDQLGNPDVSGWCVLTGKRSNRLVVLDLDTAEIKANGNEPAEVYSRFQSLSPTGFVLATPANGAHLYYRVPLNREMLGTSAGGLTIKGVDIRGEGGLVVSLGGYTRYTDKAEHKGVAYGHTASYAMLSDGDYSAIPVMTDELYDYLESIADKSVTQRKSSGKNGQATVDLDTELQQLVNGLKAEFKPVALRADDAAVREVLDLLQFVARLWDTGTKPSYDLWRNVCFAAHHASEGSAIVRDYIGNEPRFWLWDDNTGFAEWWDNDIRHNATENITIGTLKYLARVAGWGTYSQFDLKRADVVVSGCRLLDVYHPSQMPAGANVLIKQQTGGGKTYFCMTAAGMVEPSRVLFISPYITLNYDVASKANIHELRPVLTDVYLDDKRHKGAALAATPQYVTEHGIDPAHYDLIVIEEIHQLVSHLLLHSHMSIQERGKAILWLRDALRSPATVLMVDAGINQNTVDFVEALSGNPAYIVINERINPKSDVEVVSTDEALDKIISERGKLVIAAAGRNTIGGLFYFANRQGILISGLTSKQKHVRAFMRDVEKGAATYDLVAYNGAMGSGVSISDTTPDTIVQFADAWGASLHLQILNRYREQPKTVYMVHMVNSRARVDEQTAKQAISKKHRAEQDSLEQILGVMAGDKGEIASIIDAFHVRMLVEQNEQLIAPFDFYKATLERDGRQVIGQPSDRFSETMKAIKAADRAAIKGEYPNWRQGAIVERGKDNEIEDMSRVEVIRAALHQTVRDVWRREPKMGRWSEEAILLAAKQYHKGIGHIDRALDPDKDFATSMSVVYGANVGRSQTFLYAAVYLLLDACAYLLPDLKGKLSYEDLTRKAGTFVVMISQLEPQYNAFVERSRDHFASICKGKTDAELALAILDKVLGKLGINLKPLKRQRRVNGKGEYIRDSDGEIIKDYVVQNVEIIVDILAHRHAAVGEGDEIMSDLVNTVWVRAKGRQLELPLNELGERNLLGVWAERLQSQRNRDKQQGNSDLLAKQVAYEVLVEADPDTFYDVPF